MAKIPKIIVEVRGGLATVYTTPDLLDAQVTILDYDDLEAGGDEFNEDQENAEGEIEHKQVIER
jgi:hypothetical protein